MFSESDLLPISALQHLLFCPRQCALIHVEGQWAENRLTVEGRHLHEKAHDGPDEARAGVRVARGLRLRCLRLGLLGVADVVEFHPRSPPEAAQPVPVEYKRGRPKRGDYDRVQLCAQALCLEEMLSADVPAGAIFYARTRRRERVELTPELRAQTEDTARGLRELLAACEAGEPLPAVAPQPKCRNCSLREICLPGGTAPTRSVARFLQRNLRGAPAPPVQDPDT